MKRIDWSWSMLALFVAANGACASAPPQPVLPAPRATGSDTALSADDAALAAKLDAAVRAAFAGADKPAAGATVAVVRHGVTLLDAGYGRADIAAGRPMRADDVFRIGSITKPFTAAAILRLAAQGKLSLDDPADKYVAGLPASWHAITLRHLLTHTSGIFNYTALPWLQAHNAEPIAPAELVAHIAAEPLAFPPGSRFAYSNSGFYLLGLIIEKVSGQPYADFVRAEVLAPAGLTETFYCPDAQDYARAARPYRVDGAALVLAPPLSMRNPFAAGALCSTARDLVLYARALSTGRVIDAAAWKAMGTPPALASGVSHYGLGLGTGALGGHRRVGHSGGINGFVSGLVLYPDDDVVIAVLVNTEGGLAGALIEKLAAVVFGISEPEMKDLPLAPDEAASLVGTYFLPELGQTMVLVPDGGLLKVTTPAAIAARRAPGPRLRSQGGGVYAVPELRARIVFQRADGKVTGAVVHQDGQDYAAERLP